MAGAPNGVVVLWLLLWLCPLLLAHWYLLESLLVVFVSFICPLFLLWPGAIVHCSCCPSDHLALSHWSCVENGLENDLFGGCPLGQCSLAVVHLTIWPFPTGTQWEMALRMTCLVVWLESLLFGAALRARPLYDVVWRCSFVEPAALLLLWGQQERRERKRWSQKEREERIILYV